MDLVEKINGILLIKDSPKMPKGRGHKQLCSPYGRQEILNQTLTFRILPGFKQALMQLPHWSEIVRVTLEHDLDTGQFFLRRPVAERRGRGGTAHTTDAQIAVKVSGEFKERITSVNRWQSRAREALYDALDQWLISPDISRE